MNFESIKINVDEIEENDDEIENMDQYLNLTEYILEASNNGIEIYINNINESNLIKIIIKTKHFTTISTIAMHSFVEKIKYILSTVTKLDNEFLNIEKNKTDKIKDEHNENIS